MVKKYIYVTLSATSLLIFCLFIASFSTPKEYILKHKIPIDGKFMTADHLLNAYVIDENNQVLKYNPDGELIARFSENRYGSSTTVDATSPFNTLIFYKDYSTIVSIDNQMNPRTLYRLPSIELNEITAMGLSDDNYVWIFDAQESRLKKINTKYEVIQQSLELNTLLEVELNPNFIIERDKKVFVNDPEVGILVFDVFGNYYNSFPIGELESFQIFKNNVVFHKDGEIKLFDFTSFDVKSLPLPATVSEIKFIHIEKNRLFVLNESELQIYESR